MPPFNSGYSSGPSYTAFNITPADGADLPQACRQIDIDVGGTISFIDGRGDTVALTVPDGYALKCIVQRVRSTGTTATGMIGYP